MFLIWSLIGVFIFQGVDGFYNGGKIFSYLGLSVDGLRSGYVWQLLTFQFMHGGLLHIIFNIFTLYFFGMAVESTLGTRRFLQSYFGAGLVGGMLQVLMTLGLYGSRHYDVVTVGASAGIMGVIAVSSMMNPHNTIMIWGILPMRAIWFLVAAGLISFYFTIVPTGGIAHAAHLGGLLFGVAYVKWFLNNEWAMPRLRFRRAPQPRELVNAPAGNFWKKAKPLPEDEAPLPTGDFISKEVDPILDKISAHGIQSLTERERRILEAARAKMSKR